MTSSIVSRVHRVDSLSVTIDLVDGPTLTEKNYRGDRTFVSDSVQLNYFGGTLSGVTVGGKVIKKDGTPGQRGAHVTFGSTYHEKPLDQGELPQFLQDVVRGAEQNLNVRAYIRTQR